MSANLQIGGLASGINTQEIITKIFRKLPPAGGAAKPKQAAF